MRPARSISIAAAFAASALAIGTTSVICEAQAPASQPGGVQQQPSQAAQALPSGTASSVQSSTPTNAKDAWREKWVKEYWAKEAERQRKLRGARVSSTPANSAARQDAAR